MDAIFSPLQNGSLPPLSPPSTVVGYTTARTVADNNFRVIPFCTPGYNTSDIQQIAISDGGAQSIGWGGENVCIWEGVPTVVDGSAFFYWDSSMDMSGTETTYYWGDDTGNKASFSIAAGQGVVVNSAADLSAMTSGQVTDKKITFTSVADNNFTGNPFGAPIDIQAISISDDGAQSIGWGGENFCIWEGVPTVRDGSAFFYWDSSMDMSGTETTYYWGDDTGNKATYVIEPGQGVVVNCAADLKLSIEPPYSL